MQIQIFFSYTYKSNRLKEMMKWFHTFRKRSTRVQITIGAITISNARVPARATKIAGKAAMCTHTMDHTEYTTCSTAFARDTRGVVRNARVAPLTA